MSEHTAANGAPHHPRCYQNTGVPADLPDNLCDCRVLRMIDEHTALRLSESQINCLCALWLGSRGEGSNARTLDSLLRRGLATVRQHQGGPLWETTACGSDLAASILHPGDAPVSLPPGQAGVTSPEPPS